MNPLINSEDAEFYDKDCTRLMNAKFCIEDSGNLILIFKEKPASLPKDLFVLPKSRENAFDYYYCHPGGEFTEYTVEPTERTWYFISASNHGSDSSREDIRAHVSIQTPITISGSFDSFSVVIKDISAGGIMFVTDRILEAGTEFSFELTPMRETLKVAASIIRRIPTHTKGLYGYGCRFIYLPPHDEAEIRQYVLRQDMLERRCRPSK